MAWAHLFRSSLFYCQFKSTVTPRILHVLYESTTGEPWIYHVMSGPALAGWPVGWMAGWPDGLLALLSTALLEGLRAEDECRTR